MNRKLYYLYKRANGRYYVKFVDQQTGEQSKAVSTGTDNKQQAERIALKLFAERKETPNPARQIINILKTTPPDKDGIAELIEYMRKSGLIASASLPDTPSSQRFIDFALDFWDWDTSKYIKEKLMYKQTIHKTYCKRNVGFVQKHFVFFKNQLVSEINRKKIKEFQLYLMEQNLSTETINQVTRCATTALKWAYYNGLTVQDCFTGLRFCSVVHAERKILDIDTAGKLFSKGLWTSTYSKLANLVAMSTGMRMGEIQALRRCDIGEDRIYVRHNYVYKNFEGLKECKNGESREVPISQELRNLLLKQVFQNPYKEGDEAFVFWGMLPGQPMDAKPWLTALRRALKSIGYENPAEICFHAWRHFYASLMADLTPERKLQRATGHKTLAMLQHYANHAKAEDLEIIKENEEKLFSHIINAQ